METEPQAASQLRERLQLAVNALNSMGEVWPLAKDMKRQVACFAREVFKTVAVADGQTGGGIGRILAGKDGGAVRANVNLNLGLEGGGIGGMGGGGVGGMGGMRGQQLQLGMGDFEEMLEGDRWLEEIERLGSSTTTTTATASVVGGSVGSGGGV